MKSREPSAQPELVELKGLIAASLRAALEAPDALQAAVDKVAAGTRPIKWSQLLDDARSDIHRAALESALEGALRWLYSLAATGRLDIATLEGLVEAPEADLLLQLRLVDGLHKEAAEVQLDARIDTHSNGGQMVLNLAASAGKAAYDACKARFCLPGQRELWARDLDGLQAIKHQRNERHVAFELGRWPTDVEAYAAAGVTTPTGDRIKRRLGLAKKRAKR